MCRGERGLTTEARARRNCSDASGGPVFVDSGRAWLAAGWRDQIFGSTFATRTDIKHEPLYACPALDYEPNLDRWFWWIKRWSKGIMPPDPWPKFLEAVVILWEREYNGHIEAARTAPRER